jgi:hypothetical protein
MKKILVFMVIALMNVTCLADGIKMIGRDFSVADEELKPISFGLCSWTDKDVDCQLAGYVNVSLFSFWDNYLRLGAGLAVTSPDIGEISAVDLRVVVPTITTLIFEHLEVGFYAAPFYNMYNGGVDDPWGFMVGYAFGF